MCNPTYSVHLIFNLNYSLVLAFLPCFYCFQHEEASVAMFDYMYNDPANDLAKLFKQYGLTDADRIFIKEQVAGPSQNSKVCLNLD